MLHLFPLHLNDVKFIGLVFAYHIETLQLIRKQSFIQYAPDQKCFYIPYDKENYNLLKALNIPLQSYESRKYIPSNIDTYVSKGNDSRVHSAMHTREEIPQTDINIVYNKLRFWINLPYRVGDIDFIKTLSGAYWNGYHKLWSVGGIIANLQKLQSYFQYWSKEDFQKMYVLVMTSSQPKIVEIYSTPEYQQKKICVKLKGYGIDVAYIKGRADALFDQKHKRWLLTYHEDIISDLVSHYTQTGAQVYNRLFNKNNPQLRKEYTHEEKQKHLLSKYPAAYHEILKVYTDTMIRTNLKWTTIKTYTPAFFKYVKAIGTHNTPHSSSRDMNAYLSELAKQHNKHSTVHTAINAIKYYYQKVIFRHDLSIEQIQRPKREFYLPTILSTHETNTLLECLNNIKHICILYVLYGCGLRLRELLDITLDDVWWDRNQLFIRGGKGKKDRVVCLGQTLKEMLSNYFDAYQPQHWLFEGQDRINQYSSRSVQQVVKKALHKAHITKKISPHTLRHCFATHLLDEGVQLPFIQKLLGHKDVKTTMIYTHVTTQCVDRITSPLDRIRALKQSS